jgi:hypothetical protein
MEKKTPIGKTNDKKLINVVKQLNYLELVCLSSVLLSIADEVMREPKTFLPEGFINENAWKQSWSSIHIKLQEQYK